MIKESIQGFRLSPQERRAIALSEGGGEPRRIRVALRLFDAVPSAVFRRAIAAVVRRHDVLRSSFRRLPGMAVPVRLVADEAEPDWREVDLTGDGAAAAAARFDEIWRLEGRAFDVGAGPAVRAACVVMPGAERRVILSFSPLAADRRGVENILAEIAAACRTVAGAAEQSESALSYAQFAEFQNALLEGEEGADSRRIWAERDPLSVPAPRLPFAVPAADRTFRPAAVRHRFTEGETAALESLAHECGSELRDIWLAVWQVLLWRLSGRREMSVAVLAEGRDYEVFENAVGLFSRWVPVAVNLDPAADTKNVVRRLARARREAEEIADAFLWGEAGDAKAGFPAVGFEFFAERRDAAPLFSPIRSEIRVDRAELRLFCGLADGAVGAELHYDGNVMDRRDAERTLGYLRRLVRSLLEDPGRPVCRLCLLAGGARLRLLVDANRTERPFPGLRPFHRRFEDQVSSSPTAPAVVCDDDVLTYDELNRRSNRLGRHLRQLGVGPDLPVALCLERSVDWTVAALATMKAGGAYVAVTPSQPARRLAYLLEDIGAPVVIADSSTATNLPDRPGHVFRIDADWRQAESHPPSNLEGAAGLDTLAYIVFTSGSTGKPKGVMVEHRQLSNYVEGICERFDFPAAANFATVSTFAADLGNTMIFPALGGGGCLHIVSEDRAMDPVALGTYFTRHRIDCLKIVPSHLEALRESDAAEAVLPSSRLVFGGERLSAETVRAVRRERPECRIDNHYGPSETTVGVLTHRFEDRGLADLDTAPLGRPIPNTRVYVLDPFLEPQPERVTGEIWIGGACVSRGYFGKPGLSADRFLPDPFSETPGARLYRSGDLGRSGPRGIEFGGRVDDQIKIRGFRLELNEVRLRLNDHPRIRDSVVTLRPDGEGRSVLVAFYVSRQEIDFAQLHAHLAEELLEETLPNAFVRLARLPLTLNGKVNTDALPSLDEVHRKRRQAHVAPRTSTEEIMSEIWADVLGVERVGIHDNFFELGGHSLLAIRIISRQRDAFQVDLPLRLLFEIPTVAGLAEVIDRESANQVQTIPDLPLAARGVKNLEDQLAELDDLADDEVAQLLERTAHDVRQ